MGAVRPHLGGQLFAGRRYAGQPQIIFYTGGQGKESLLYNYYGEVWEEYYTFYWRWANSLQNSIALSYPGGGTLYMDHVYIKLDLFSCLLDGMFVTFRGK